MGLVDDHRRLKGRCIGELSERYARIIHIIVIADNELHLGDKHQRQGKGAQPMRFAERPDGIRIDPRAKLQQFLNRPRSLDARRKIFEKLAHLRVAQQRTGGAHAFLVTQGEAAQRSGRYFGVYADVFKRALHQGLLGGLGGYVHELRILLENIPQPRQQRAHRLTDPGRRHGQHRAARAEARLHDVHQFRLMGAQGGIGKPQFCGEVGKPRSSLTLFLRFANPLPKQVHQLRAGIGWINGDQDLAASVIDEREEDQARSDRLLRMFGSVGQRIES